MDAAGGRGGDLVRVQDGGERLDAVDQARSWADHEPVGPALKGGSTHSMTATAGR